MLSSFSSSLRLLSALLLLAVACREPEEEPPGDSGPPPTFGGSGGGLGSLDSSGGSTAGSKNEDEFPFWYPETTQFNGNAERILGLPDGSIVLLSRSRSFVFGTRVQNLTAEGEIRWSFEIPELWSTALALDDSGRVVIAGQFQGRLSLGDFSAESTVNPGLPDEWRNGPSGVPSNDILLLRLNEQGRIEHLHTIGGIGDQQVAHLARDQAGHLHLVGRFSGRITADGFDEGATEADGWLSVDVYDRFIARLDDELRITHVINRGPGQRTSHAGFTEDGGLLLFNEYTSGHEGGAHLSLIDPETNVTRWRLETPGCLRASFDVGANGVIALALHHCRLNRDDYESRLWFLSSDGAAIAQSRWGGSKGSAPFAVLAQGERFIVTGRLSAPFDFGTGLLVPEEHPHTDDLLFPEGVYAERERGIRGSPVVVSYDERGTALQAELGRGKGWSTSLTGLLPSGFVVGGFVALESQSAIEFTERRTHFSASSFITWFPD